MTTVSIKELHARTGEWVRRAAESGEIDVIDRGLPVSNLTPLPAGQLPRPTIDPFLHRKLFPGFAQLQKSLVGGTDSVQIISEDRDRA